LANVIELVSEAVGRVRQAKAPFSETVLVCSKCAKKFPDRRGAKGVRSALKSALKTRRWGKIRLVETKCLDLCPKRRLVLASGATLANHKLVVVDAGFDADAALIQLLGEPRPAA
jgi:predicted metal-binding protein